MDKNIIHKFKERFYILKDIYKNFLKIQDYYFTFDLQYVETQIKNDLKRLYKHITDYCALFKPNYINSDFYDMNHNNINDLLRIIENTIEHI